MLYIRAYCKSIYNAWIKCPSLTIPRCRHHLLFQRKMLAIYLHHDHSVLTNVFCTQALCADSVVSFLSANFVTFG